MIEMKDSGVEWIGAIPTSWEVSRIKELFYEINERCSNSNDYKLLSVSEYYGVAPKAERISSEDMLTHAETLDGYKICKINDLVMNIMLAWKRAMGVSKYDGIVSPAYCVYRSKKEMNSTYFHYLFRTDVYANLFKQYSTGIIDSRLRLYPDKFLALKCQVPPLETQHRIADYLDERCKKIDAIIEKQQNVIEKLKEYKLSVITEAVTKGLNPDVEMKDSGIEWIGEIPENWQIQKLKQLVTTTKGFAFKADDYRDFGVPIVKVSDIKNGTVTHGNTFVSNEDCDKYSNVKLHFGDILMTTVGSTPDVINSAVGQLGRVPIEFEGSLLNQNAVRITSNAESLNNTFLFYFLSIKRFREHLNLIAHGTANQASISLKDILEFKVLIPNIEEQAAIAEYLESKCLSLNNAIVHKQSIINKLTEYKKSLIYEVVTGKKEV